MKTKHEYLNLYLFELDTLSKHFEEMAQQGWMLSSIQMLSITYQECTPQTVHFYIDIYHKGGYLNPTIIPADEKEYGSFISEFGYKFVTRTANFQVFMSVKEDIIPIHSDTREDKKAQSKTILKYEIVNHLFLLLLFPTFLLNFLNLRMYSFTSNIIILFFAIIPFALFLLLYRIYPTLRWIFRKDKYKISVSAMLKRNKIANRLSIILIVYIIASIALSNTTTMIPYFLMFVISLFCFFIIDPLLARFIKKYHSVFALAICLYIGMLVNFNFIISSLPMDSANQGNGELSYLDLRSELPKVFERDVTLKQSFLLRQERYYEYFQDNQDQTRDFNKDISFHYELYTIKVPLMLDYFQDLALEDMYQRISTGENKHTNSKYSLYQSRRDQCLIWDNYILFISIYDTGHDEFTPVSEEQISTIIEQIK